MVSLAERQEGLLRREQLEALGLNANAISRRRQAGRLHLRHRNVYTLGHRLLRLRGEWLAATWAVEDAVLSHLSAAAFHGWYLGELLTQHVTTTGRATSCDGLRVHRARRIDPRDIERHGPLVVTRAARTVIDLAELLAYDELRPIVDRMRRFDVAAVRTAQERVPGKRGAALVRRLCGRMEAHTRSEFERRYLRFCVERGLPLPDAVNEQAGGFLVDCHYRAVGIVVELDGRAFHLRQDQFKADRRRDRKLLVRRQSTVRLVWEDLDDEDAAETARDLRKILIRAA
ncbi:MAG: type IV toxin-antitoxin system AbiEi family antitoxin domain-containing protein [Solirubrobacterales bacterium]|nr:type IV toxin-antitoxin system AbiEi family antitoxin domain-containing protein [Solirubrobacterales bacterium]